MKKAYVRFGLLLVLIFSLVACSGGEEGEKEVKKVDKTNKDVTIAVSATLTGMDPHDTNDTLSNSVQKTMIEGLVGFDEEMNVIPVLAESYESNEEATEFTFKLREGIEFHDGTPFNAEAVKVNFERVANPENGLKRQSLYGLIDTIEIISDYEVKFTLSEPFGAMLNTFAHPAGGIQSPKALEEFGKDVARHPVGTGPFKFVDWRPSEYLEVEKNENYWKEGYPKVDKVTFKPVTENGSRVAMLQTGEADFIYPVPTEQVEALQGKDGIVVDSEPSIVVQYASLNTMKEPFNNPKVREALNLAVNKEAFIKVVLNGEADVLDSIIAPNVQYYEKQTPYGFDVEKAKELLKEAGYESGFKTTVWGGNSSTAVKAMEFLQQQLAQINVELEVLPMESGTLSDRIWSVENPADAEVDIYYGGWSPSTGDADWGIRPLIGGEAAFPPNSYNVSYYSNDKVNAGIAAALETANSDERAAAYKIVQQEAWNDAPWIFLATTRTLAGKRDYIEGAYLLPDNSLSITEIEIKE